MTQPYKPTRICAVRGCEGRTDSQWAVLCPMHKMRNRRFGDPAVRACLRLTELRPYLMEVRRLCAKGDRERTERVFAAMQERLRSVAESTLAERLTYVIRGPRRFQQAEQEIVRVTAGADPIQAAHRIGALFLMHERVPGRWPTERAFRFELVRLWRKLAGIAYGSQWDDRQGKVRRMYREVSPVVVEALSEWLVTIYKPLVARLLAAAKADQVAPKTWSDALASALWSSAVKDLLTASGSR